MRPDLPCPPARRWLASVAVVALLTGCGGSTDADAGGPTPAVGTSGTTSAPTSTLAPSGDEELDSLDADLAAFEEEDRGLDQAVAAAEGE